MPAGVTVTARELEAVADDFLDSSRVLAAQELEDGAGIASTTVASLLAGKKLPRRVVLVVDEADMDGTRQLAELVEEILAVHGKVVLVGDHRQLPELETGGVFRGLVHRGLAVALRENRRQVDAWEREAMRSEAFDRPGEHPENPATEPSGAAQESNLPTAGLRRPAGFEDRMGHQPRAAPQRRLGSLS